ncbi:MAG: ComEC/Rec2 family competence protein, partial [Verrucomicrobiales bacterium]|nr:ComEC/Rec2 family competence protein [Verrucomicrobiales bacterium]
NGYYVGLRSRRSRFDSWWVYFFMRNLWNQVSKRALRAPLFWIALAAALGIFAADQNWIWLLALPVLCLFVFRKQRASVVLISGMVLCCALFSLLHHRQIARIAQFPLLPSLAGSGAISVSGKGWLASDTNLRTGKAVRAILVVEELRVRDSLVPLPHQDRVIALIDHPASADLTYGAEISFSGRLRKIEPATSPGAFDPSIYFYRSANAVAEININAGDRCLATGRNHGSALKRYAILSRQWMEKALSYGVKQHHLERNGVILAMALGAREKSPDDVEDFFRLSGTMHIFAVSGLHVGVVAAMFWFVLKWLGFSRRSAVLIIIQAVLFYALLTGMRPSSFRAAVMLSVFLAGFALKRRPSPVNGLGLAALVLLTANTQQLFLPGFQLSFCVVLALILIGTYFSEKLHDPFRIDEFIPKRRVPVWRTRLDQGVKIIAVGSGVSAASWIGSVALMNEHFSGISPVGLVANILMVPIASGIVVIAGISILLFGLKLSFLSAILNHFNLLLATFLSILAQFFAGLPGAHIHTGNETVPKKEMISLDVMGLRGGSAILATTENQTWMIDSGGKLTFRQQVLPLLRERGINRIDCLILTHGDSGHIGAVPYLLHHLTPDLVIESPLKNRARIYPEIREIIEKRGINRIEISAGQKLKWTDNAIWDPLYPGDKDPPTGVADDRCLVLRLRTGPWKILFTFDIGFLLEKQLIEENWYLDSDIWIRGQHSTTQSGTGAFIEKIDPRVVISSHSGFPPHEKLSKEWMAKVKDTGAELITLDEAGCVNLQISDQKIVITPYLGDGEIVLER